MNGIDTLMSTYLIEGRHIILYRPEISNHPAINKFRTMLSNELRDNSSRSVMFVTAETLGEARTSSELPLKPFNIKDYDLIEKYADTVTILDFQNDHSTTYFGALLVKHRWGRCTFYELEE